MPEEGNHQYKILTDLRSFGKYCEAFKIIKASDNGEPDIFFTFALTGAVLIEAKRRDGSARKLQKNKIKKLNLCGTQTFLCHCWEEWFDIKKTLGLLDMDAIKEAHEKNEIIYRSP